MDKKFIVRGAPIVPALCAIFMTVLWYVTAYFFAGEWQFDFDSVGFTGLETFELVYKIVRIVFPVFLFVGALFLAELDLKWMAIPMAIPVALQVYLELHYLTLGHDYFLDNPFNFFVPFVLFILFFLTVTGVIPTKWLIVIVSALCVLAPTVLTFFGIGEFAVRYESYGITVYYWSTLVYYALYPTAVCALSLQMRAPRPEDFVTLEELRAAYEEQQNAGQTEAAETLVAMAQSAEAAGEQSVSETAETVENVAETDAAETENAAEDIAETNDEQAQ